MTLLDAVISALDALRLHKLRSALTMLGIIIGVGAVIAMVAIGEGAKSTIRSQISALGTNVLIVLPGSNVQGGVRAGTGNVNTLVDTDARAMTRELRSVAYASPVMRRQEQLKLEQEQTEKQRLRREQEEGQKKK
jgi:putative ABC transport system permease protein